MPGDGSEAARVAGHHQAHIGFAQQVGPLLARPLVRILAVTQSHTALLHHACG
mgnify:CR=1 FL=1